MHQETFEELEADVWVALDKWSHVLEAELRELVERTGGRD